VCWLLVERCWVAVLWSTVPCSTSTGTQAKQALRARKARSSRDLKDLISGRDLASAATFVSAARRQRILFLSRYQECAHAWQHDGLCHGS
jgi:hypothetical protein